MDGCEYPLFRRDQHSNAVGKIVYIREGLIAKRLSDLETKSTESICLEFTNSNRK